MLCVFYYRCRFVVFCPSAAALEGGPHCEASRSGSPLDSSCLVIVEPNTTRGEPQRHNSRLVVSSRCRVLSVGSCSRRWRATGRPRPGHTMTRTTTWTPWPDAQVCPTRRLHTPLASPLLSRSPCLSRRRAPCCFALSLRQPLSKGTFLFRPSPCAGLQAARALALRMQGIRPDTRLRRE